MDSNVVVYAFTGRSEQCRRLLARCASLEVLGLVIEASVAEVAHRLMIEEAWRLGLIATPGARQLERKPAVVRKLRWYWACMEEFFAAGLKVIGGDVALLRESRVERERWGLLTIDSMVAACARLHDVSEIATADRAFLWLPHLRVRQPTDLV
ncbi:MAG TPA: type II toxin-antitoxin system VapC family toxin [Terriglobales bacterium]|nr:type II toxin-antitoxin system VapC family toxin [Terriglobales bacterium]